MTDEVKAALKWWQDHRPYEEHFYGAEEYNDLLEKMTILCDAYAAEHPVDDDMPITNPWLPTIGLEYNDRDGHITQWATVPDHGDCVFVEKHDSDEHYTLRFDCDGDWPRPI